MVNSKELNNTISELEVQVKKIKSISEIYTELSSLKSELRELQATTNSSAEKIEGITIRLEAKLSEYQDLIVALQKNNKEFQKELEQHISSKLEKHKSDIQVDIRNEGSQIQRGFENSLNQNFHILNSKLLESEQRQNKQLTNIKWMLILCVVLLTGLGIKLFL